VPAKQCGRHRQTGQHRPRTDDDYRDGVVQMVIQDQHTYQQQIDTIALLNILALGQQSINEGRVVAADTVFAARKRP
jgi:hypothetical protein